MNGLEEWCRQVELGKCRRKQIHVLLLFLSWRRLPRVPPLFLSFCSLVRPIVGPGLELPEVPAVLAAHHFLPQTTHNITSYLGQVEERYFPTVAEKHEIAKAHSAMTWERLKEGTKSGREQANKMVGEGVGKVQELTGLKLKETLGWGEGVLNKAKETAADLTAKVEEKAEEVKVAVENKAEEVKKEVEKKPEPPKRLV